MCKFKCCNVLFVNFFLVFVVIVGEENLSIICSDLKRRKSFL